jgi:hypothetical protein
MTEKQIKQYHENVDENIRKYGYHSTFVFSDKSPSFCYSTGIFKSFGIPEIFISSLPQNLSNTLIQCYVDKFKDTPTVPLNKRLEDLTDRFSVYLIEVPVENLIDYVLSSVRFYDSNPYKYVQLIYPDTTGLFPNDAGYGYDQMIMGQFVN